MTLDRKLEIKDQLCFTQFHTANMCHHHKAQVLLSESLKGIVVHLCLRLTHKYTQLKMRGLNMLKSLQHQDIGSKSRAQAFHSDSRQAKIITILHGEG